MKSSETLTILFVDDEESVLSSVRRLVRRESYQTCYASSAQSALEIIARQKIDILVTDLNMPVVNGVELIQQVQSKQPDILCLVVSATRDVDLAVHTINAAKIYRFIPKTIEPDNFRATLLEAVDYYQLKRERALLLENLASVNAELNQSNTELRTTCDELSLAQQEQERLRQTSMKMEQRIAEQLLHTAMPTVNGLSLAALSLPVTHIGGDFYECLNYDQRGVDLIIADVMGKGSLPALIGAGLKAAILKTLAQNRCAHGTTPAASASPICPIEQVLKSIHDLVVKNLIDLETYASLCYARYNCQTQELSFIDCGHPKTIWYQAQQGQVSFLEGEDPPLGLWQQLAYHEKRVTLATGDLLLFYTDGVTEAENPQEQEFGLQQLTELVVREHQRPVDELLQTIYQTVQAYTGPQGLSDDFTCIAMRVEG